MNPTFEQAKRYGFIFPGARMWATPENRARIAQDAALILRTRPSPPSFWRISTRWSSKS